MSKILHIQQSPDQMRALGIAATALRARAGIPLRVTTSTGEVVLDLDATVVDALSAFIEVCARSSRVDIVADDAFLSTTEAAKQLGVSRQFLVRLLDQGKIAYEMVNSHHRVRQSAVSSYLAERRARFDLGPSFAARQAELALPETEAFAEGFERLSAEAVSASGTGPSG